MYLGSLIAELKKHERTDNVRFNFGYFRPKDITSYRGYYEHLALTYENETHSANVGELLDMLEAAIGQHYEGYKGGSYRASVTTKVYVANWGEAPGTTIIAVKHTDVGVMLMTGNEEDPEED